MPARLRIQAGEAPQFPEWWSAAAVASAFEVGSSRPEAVVLPMPTWRWQAAEFEAALELAGAARAGGRPSAVYLRFDSWDDPARAWRGEPAWADHVHRLAAEVDVVAGPQLPARGGPARPLALPYPPLVARRRRPPGLADTTVDVQFAGGFRPAGWAGPATDTRDRHHRGYLLAQLERGLGDRRLDIRSAAYWDGDEHHQARLRARTLVEMDRARIVVAPAGFGYLTFRHAEGWARGRAVLSEPVPVHTLVPEPERWAEGEIVLVYDPSGSDIAEVAAAALDDPDRLEAVAGAGWEYGRRWTRPAGQAQALARSLAELLT